MVSLVVVARVEPVVLGFTKMGSLDLDLDLNFFHCDSKVSLRKMGYKLVLLFHSFFPIFRNFY